MGSKIVDGSPPVQIVDIDIALTAVRGTVTLGGRPLRGRLTFSLAREGARVTLESDAEGSFGGTLPAGRTFNVQVSAQVPRVERRLVNVPVPDSGEIVLSLPDTRLGGRVVDERGRAQSRTLIAIRSLNPGSSEGAVQLHGDESGSFELRGLPPGRRCPRRTPDGLQRRSRRRPAR
jgi:hypothetical protein